MSNYTAFFIILVISSVWISSCEAEIDNSPVTIGLTTTTFVTTIAAPSCVMNGRFADLSDPCRQSYITCLWIGTGFLTWPSKCPNKLVFNQITSTCVQSSTPLPAICEPTTTTTTPVPTTTTPTTPVPTTTTPTTTTSTTPVPTTTTPTTPVPTTTTPTTPISIAAIASTAVAPSCVMNGRFADPSDPCGQTYILCYWDGTQFFSWILKCPNSLIFYQITSECVESKTTLPPSCGSLATAATPVATAATPAATAATPAATAATPAATVATPTATVVTPAATAATPSATAATPSATAATASATAATASATAATPAATAATTAATAATPAATAATPSPTAATPAPTAATPATTTTTTAAPVTTTVTTTTTAAPSCIANGRFADPSDPCGQAYIICSWDGTKFLVWKLKCPMKLVFNQITAKCVRPTTALPDTC